MGHGGDSNLWGPGWGHGGWVCVCMFMGDMKILDLENLWEHSHG